MNTKLKVCFFLFVLFLLGTNISFAVTTFVFQNKDKSGASEFHPISARISIKDSAVASGYAERGDIIYLSVSAGIATGGLEYLQAYFDPHTIQFSADRTSIDYFQSQFRRLGCCSWGVGEGNPGINISASRIAVTGERIFLTLEILAAANGSWVLEEPVVPIIAPSVVPITPWLHLLLYD